jgi:hypothetical protein
MKHRSELLHAIGFRLRTVRGKRLNVEVVCELDLDEQECLDHRSRLLKADPHCTYCGCLVRAKTATLDHVIPKSQGGRSTEGNLVLCCKACNSVKAARPPGEFVDLLERMVANARPLAVCQS